MVVPGCLLSPSDECAGHQDQVQRRADHCVGLGDGAWSVRRFHVGGVPRAADHAAARGGDLCGLHEMPALRGEHHLQGGSGGLVQSTGSRYLSPVQQGPEIGTVSLCFPYVATYGCPLVALLQTGEERSWLDGWRMVSV